MFWKRKRHAPLSPDWLIVGLGNPGPEYVGTRHNVGFELVDRIAAKHHIKLRTSKHRALIGEGHIEGAAVVLVKPLTFVNLCGNAVGPLASQYGVKPERVLVISDDLDLPAGAIRLREKGSAGGHNGLKSLIAALRTEAFPRLKLGIGSQDRGEAARHVLGRFRPEERARIETALQAASEAVEAVIRDGIPRTMNWVNAKRDAAVQIGDRGREQQ